MHSHLDIEINNTPMVLPEGFSLSVTEENPLFHDVGMHSDPVSVPMDGNRNVFRNVDDPMSALRPVSMEHLPAKIIVGGLPMRSGTVVVQENEELKNAFAFNIDESKQSFEDLIGDLKCQDVPLFNDERIPVGEKISDVVLYDGWHFLHARMIMMDDHIVVKWHLDDILALDGTVGIFLLMIEGE